MDEPRADLDTRDLLEQIAEHVAGDADRLADVLDATLDAAAAPPPPLDPADGINPHFDEYLRSVGVTRFYLGTHVTTWLWRDPAAPSLFVSDHQLSGRRSPYPRATTRWACDSGAFTELHRHGEWTSTPEQYAARLDRYAAELGGLDWAAPQDWLCAPDIVERTGRTVAEHLTLTVGSVVTLRALTSVPIIPVLQGWTLADYEACAWLYGMAGIRLDEEPTVGIGSIAGRGDTWEVEEIVRRFADRGYRLHGFGVKAGGLARYAWRLASVDSMAWSYEARRRPPLPGCTGHKACQNCVRYAEEWRDRTMRHITHHQRVLW